MIFFSAILTFSWALFVSLFAIPSIIQVAHKKQILDIPNNRRQHLSDTPRLGGLAIFAGFISSILLFGEFNNSIQKLIAATIIIFFIGLKDDMVSVSAFKKFFVQILAASIIVFLGDIKIDDFQGILSINKIPEGVSYLFTLAVVLGITNAFNLIDGLDGLAGSLALLACILYCVIFFVLGGNSDAPYVLISLALAGALIGFLKYNFYKAEIFMGDTGSLISGFIIAFLAIKIVLISPEFNMYHYSLPALAIAPIIIPIADTLRVFVIRVLASSSPFSPDNNHLHHRLIGLGWSQLSIVGFIVLYTFVNVFFVLLLEGMDSTILLAGMAAMIFFTLVTIEILYKKRNKSCIKSI